VHILPVSKQLRGMNPREGNGANRASVFFIPYLLVLAAVLTVYLHAHAIKAVGESKLWGPIEYVAGQPVILPKWASWTLGALIFLIAFEMLRRLDSFFLPKGSAVPSSQKKKKGDEEERSSRSEREKERAKQREEQKKGREQRKRERARKREEDKARREKSKEEELRKRAKKAAKERARKVKEAAEKTVKAEDRKLELNHGKALGLQGKLTPDEIKKKYRELMTQYHPDKVRSMGDEIREVAERKAKEINEAYDYFRKKYDL
tara:strand:- start:115 stop:900 length:786 start_codon:yes stop_codon:yes gene_type:complete